MSVERVSEAHKKQVQTYSLTGCKLGFLSIGEALMKRGIRV